MGSGWGRREKSRKNGESNENGLRTPLLSDGAVTNMPGVLFFGGGAPENKDAPENKSPQKTADEIKDQEIVTRLSAIKLKLQTQLPSLDRERKRKGKRIKIGVPTASWVGTALLVGFVGLSCYEFHRARISSNNNNQQYNAPIALPNTTGTNTSCFSALGDIENQYCDGRDVVNANLTEPEAEYCTQLIVDGCRDASAKANWGMGIFFSIFGSIAACCGSSVLCQYSPLSREWYNISYGDANLSEEERNLLNNWLSPAPHGAELLSDVVGRCERIIADAEYRQSIRVADEFHNIVPTALTSIVGEYM